MSDAVQYIEQTISGSTGKAKIAYRQTPRKASGHDAPAFGSPSEVLFCGGFHSNMDGGKAAFLHERCLNAGRAFTRFDYRGHGLSGGAFADGTIGDWLCDADLVLNTLCGPRVTIVGSSMGAWMALNLTKKYPERVAGLVLIAPAPDFPRKLMLPSLSAEQRQALDRDGVWYRPSEFEDDPYPITKALIDESAAHEVLDGDPIRVDGPVYILHGDADEVVPLHHAQRVAECLVTAGLAFDVIQGGGHRLSEPAELERLWRAVCSV